MTVAQLPLIARASLRPSAPGQSRHGIQKASAGRISSKTTASRVLDSMHRARSSSPAIFPLEPIDNVPGSPLFAVASYWMDSPLPLRPPGPASSAMKPMKGLPGPPHPPHPRSTHDHNDL